MVNEQTVWEDAWQRAQAEIRRRAAFEIPCNEPEIQLTLLATTPGTYPPQPASVGATGCGKRLTYVSRQQTWLQNSKTDLAPPAPAPAPQ